jgi:hypothetical protein
MDVAQSMLEMLKTLQATIALLVFRADFLAGTVFNNGQIVP